MDIIIIGKATHNRMDKPHLIYCGQSRDEAAAAVKKAAAEFKLVRFYELNPEPMRPVQTPLSQPKEPQIAQPIPQAAETSETEKAVAPKKK